jgi:hypothetical protein
VFEFAGLGDDDENACAAAATRPTPTPADGALALALASWPSLLPAALLFRALDAAPTSEGNAVIAKGATATAV